MSRDTEGSGFAGVNVHRSSTKVNLWMIVGIVTFLVVMAVAAFWVSRRAAAPASVPPKVAESEAHDHP
jgi:flagellar basal body-associated protein FliL